MTQKFIQASNFKLSGSGVTATQTTIPLTSFNLPDGTAIASGDLGTTNYGTLEPGTSREEIISFTGFTGTTLTGVTRGLKFVSPYTTDATLKKAHAGGTVFVLSNNPQLYEDLISFDNDETVTGTFTFTNPEYPRIDTAVTAPTDDEQFATKKYVDDIGAGGTLSKNRTVVAGTAGETVVAGEIVYFDLTDNEWKLADASASSTSENVLLGVAQGAGSDGVAISGGVLLGGVDANQTGLTIGDKQFLSDTAGALSTTTGTVEVSIGIAKSATEIYFAPNFDQKITEDIQDALAGTSGTPSATNKYVTNDDTSATSSASKVVRADSASKISVWENGVVKTLTAGEAINGATLPVAVYQYSSDNEIYACDGNDLTKMNFIGFAISNSTDGNPIQVQFDGVVSGFTGLSEGLKYYAKDDKTIGTTVGTYQVTVGRAISETQLVIIRELKATSGVATLSATGDTVITTGFKAKSVKINLEAINSNGNSYSHGGWTQNGGNNCVYGGYDGTTPNFNGSSNTYAYYYIDLSSTTKYHRGTVTVNNTQITISNVKGSTSANVCLRWEAIE